MTARPEIVLKAAMMAADVHASQQRKGHRAIPYVNHVIEVATLVAEAGGTEDEIVAALLHDVVEDSDVTNAEVANSFGSGVARIVDGLTDDPAWADLPRPERKAKQAAHLPDEPDSVRRIKIADQTSNLRDIAREPEAWDAAAAQEYISGAEMVVAACRGVSPALETAFDVALAEAMHKTGGQE